MDNKTEFDKKKENRFVLIETIFWTLIPAMIFYRIFYLTLRHGTDNIIESEFNSLLLGLFIALIPILFRLIFGLLPFQLVRRRFVETKSSYKISGSNNIININKDTNEIDIPGGEEYLYSLTVEAKLLSEKIFTRAGVYLLIGILIAISGIVYFSYNLTGNIETTEIDWNNILLTFLPRFGGLFFVEFIAFFFLKQYRITMDEFRYYEMIKRQRESNLAIILLESELGEKSSEFEGLMQHLNFFNNLDIVKKGETTTLSENRKFSNEELDIFKTILDKFDLNKNAPH